MVFSSRKKILLSINSSTGRRKNKFSDFKFSINNASQEILWLPVPKERKKQAKPVIDSAIRASLEGVVGILIFVLVQFKIVPTDKLNLLSIIALVGIIGWIWNRKKNHFGRNGNR